MREHKATLTNGAAAAAVLASGLGSFALGLVTTLAEAVPALKNALVFSNPAGPLSGKTTVAVVVWLVAWAALHSAWKDKTVNFNKTFIATLALIALGLLGTFPPFFEAFAK